MPGPAVYGGRLLTGRPRAAYMRSPTWQQWFWEYLRPQKRHVRPINRTCLFAGGVGTGHARPCRMAGGSTGRPRAAYAVPTWQQWFFGNISAHKKRHVRPINRTCLYGGRLLQAAGLLYTPVPTWAMGRQKRDPIVHAGRRGRACPALPCMAGGCLQAGRGPHICGPYMAAMVFWEYLRPQKKACTTYPIVHAFFQACPALPC